MGTGAVKIIQHLTGLFSSSFDLQLENWGVDLEELKAKEVKRVLGVQSLGR